MRPTLLTLVLLAGAAAPGWAQHDKPSSSARPSEIVATGNGVLSLRPDVAVVRLAVQARDRTAAGASAQSAVLLTSLIDTLAAHAVPRDSVHTTGYGVRPEYNRESGRQELNSFLATASVTVRLRDLSRTGELIDAALKGGATELSSVSFEAADTRMARDSALALAVLNARHSAEVAARAAGGTLGRLVSLSFGGAPTPVLAEQRGFLSSATAPPINPEDLTVTASVTGRWEFLPQR